jgi:hypothetical protein
MAQQQDASPSLQGVAQLGAAAIQAGIALWWRWPGLLAGVPAHACADMDGREREREKEKAATAKIVAAQIEAMRTLAEALNTKAPADAPVQAEPARRTAK